MLANTPISNASHKGCLVRTQAGKVLLLISSGAATATLWGVCVGGPPDSLGNVYSADPTEVTLLGKLESIDEP